MDVAESRPLIFYRRSGVDNPAKGHTKLLHMLTSPAPRVLNTVSSGTSQQTPQQLFLSSPTYPSFKMPSQTETKPELESSFYIPTIDISPYLSDPTSVESLKIVNQVREACMGTGFFQYVQLLTHFPLPADAASRIINHGIPKTLQDEVFAGSEAFFKLPTEEKKKLDKSCSVGASNRGYEIIGNQGLQEGTLPDLKEVCFLSSLSPFFFSMGRGNMTLLPGIRKLRLRNVRVLMKRNRDFTSAKKSPPQTRACKTTPS